METRGIVLLLSGIAVIVSCVLSFNLIFQHLKYFSKPQIQSKIVGILWMVPIYAIDSYLSLCTKDLAPYLDMLRDCYEAYVLYLFLALLMSYLGDGDDKVIVEHLNKCPPTNHMLPFSLCHSEKEVPQGAKFIKFCKFGAMQYIVLRPMCTFLAIILSWANVYNEGEFSLTSGWMYILIIMNISVGYAVYCLGLFYIILHDALEPHEPFTKFVAIKAVLFFSFWQGVIISCLVKLNVIHEIGNWTSANVALAIQDMLICFEMMFISIFHHSAFPVAPYLGGPARHTNFFEDQFAHYSALRDFNEVMPIVLPGTGFKPGIVSSEYTRVDGEDDEDEENNLYSSNGSIKNLVGVQSDEGTYQIQMSKTGDRFARQNTTKTTLNNIQSTADENEAIHLLHSEINESNPYNFTFEDNELHKNFTEEMKSDCFDSNSIVHQNSTIKGSYRPPGMKSSQLNGIATNGMDNKETIHNNKRFIGPNSSSTDNSSLQNGKEDTEEDEEEIFIGGSLLLHKLNE